MRIPPEPAAGASKDAPAPPPAKNLPCPFCKRSFVNAHALLSHQRESEKCSSAVARGMADGSVTVVDDEDLVVTPGEAAGAVGGALAVGGLIAGAAALSMGSLKPNVMK
eukprot:2419326-Rhodomonas_salina.1